MGSLRQQQRELTVLDYNIPIKRPTKILKSVEMGHVIGRKKQLLSTTTTQTKVLRTARINANMALLGFMSAQFFSPSHVRFWP